MSLDPLDFAALPPMKLLRFLKVLIKSELIGLLALLVFSLLVGIGAFIGSHMPVQYSVFTSFKSIDAAIILALGLALLGFYPVIFYGSPLYAVLHYKKRASLWAAALVGVVPGILICFSNVHLGILVASCGLVIASITHGFSLLVKPNL